MRILPRCTTELERGRGYTQNITVGETQSEMRMAHFNKNDIASAYR